MSCSRFSSKVVCLLLIAYAIVFFSVAKTFAVNPQILVKYSFNDNSTYLDLSDKNSAKKFIPGNYSIKAYLSYKGKMKTQTFVKQQLKIDKDLIKLRPGDNVNGSFSLTDSDNLDGMVFEWNIYSSDVSDSAVQFSYIVEYKEDNKTFKKVYTPRSDFNYQHLENEAKIIFSDENINKNRIQDRSYTYLIKRELGLKGDDIWQKTKLSNNILLQRRFSHRIKPNQILQITLDKNTSLDNIALSLSNGKPGKVDKIIDVNESEFHFQLKNRNNVYTLPLYNIFENKIKLDEPYLVELSVFVKNYNNESLRSVKLLEVENYQIADTKNIKTIKEGNNITHKISFDDILYNNISQIIFYITNNSKKTVYLKNKNAYLTKDLYTTIPAFLDKNNSRINKWFPEIKTMEKDYINWFFQKFYIDPETEKEVLNLYLAKYRAQDNETLQNEILEKIKKEKDKLANIGYVLKGDYDNKKVVFKYDYQVSLSPDDLLVIRDLSLPKDVKAKIIFSSDKYDNEIELPLERDGLNLPLRLFINKTVPIDSVKLIFEYQNLSGYPDIKSKINPPQLYLFSYKKTPIKKIFDQPYFQNGKKKYSVNECSLSKSYENILFYNENNSTKAYILNENIPSEITFECPLPPVYDYVHWVRFRLKIPEFISKKLPIKIGLNKENSKIYNLDNSTQDIVIPIDNEIDIESLKVTIPTNKLIIKENSEFEISNLVIRGRYIDTPLKEVILADPILTINQKDYYLQSELPHIYSYYNESYLGTDYINILHDISYPSQFFEVDKVVLEYQDKLDNSTFIFLSSTQDNTSATKPFLTKQKLIFIAACLIVIGIIVLLVYIFKEYLKNLLSIIRKYTPIIASFIFDEIKNAFYKIYAARYILNAIVLIVLMAAFAYVLLAYREPNRFPPVFLTLLIWIAVCIYIFYRPKILSSIKTETLNKIIYIRNAVFIFGGTFIIIYSIISHIVYINTKLYVLLFLPFLYLYFSDMCSVIYKTFKYKDTKLYSIFQNCISGIKAGWMHAVLFGIIVGAMVESFSFVLPIFAYIVLTVGFLSKYKKSFIKYAFLISLIVVALSSVKFFGATIFKDYKISSSVLAIFLGTLTFWYNKEVIDEVEREKEQEDIMEQKRAREFDEKYGRLHPPLKYSLVYNIKNLFMRRPK